MRLSTSFSDEEVLFLDELLRLVARGGDPSMLLRSKSFASVARKIIAMKAKMADTPAEGSAEDTDGGR